MPLLIGTEVVVLSLGGKKGVVEQAGRGGHYRVRIGNAVVSCREGDLNEVPVARGQTRSRRTRAAPARTEASTKPPSTDRIDLHGLTVDDALARVVEAIDLALRRDSDRLEVVHGKGSGRIREALHRRLATIPVVASFRLDPKNAGITWVYF
jgi:DNA mismatch repair protein MutS2